MRDAWEKRRFLPGLPERAPFPVRLQTAAMAWGMAPSVDPRAERPLAPFWTYTGTIDRRVPNRTHKMKPAGLHWAATDADVNARSEDGQTPLQAAARFCTTQEVVTALVEADADPNARTGEGLTPLHCAAGSSAIPGIVTVLVHAGAGPDARDKKGWTPLHDAAGSRTPGVVTALVDAGGNPNARDRNGRTPLHVAACLGNAVHAVVRAFLDAGADPAARDENDETPWEQVKMDSMLRGTDVFRRLKDGGGP